MKKAIIVGGGPAGLTAAYELLKQSDIHPVVYEMEGNVGGISQTVNYKGNRMDIGGHRFFSKSSNPIPYSNFSEVVAVIEYDNNLKAALYPGLMFIETAIKNIVCNFK